LLTRRLFRFSHNPWDNGLHLALLNIGLAAFCATSFLAVLLGVSWLNRIMLARGGSPSAELPFPYPLLLLFYVIVFLVAWIRFGQRLPAGGQKRLLTAFVGAAPLFGLGLLGYAGAVGALFLNSLDPNRMPAASFIVFSGISTLILLAGFTCAGLILLLGNRRSDQVTKPA
jgi:hypothetical protein